jgi:hypothetical protein
MDLITENMKIGLHKDTWHANFLVKHVNLYKKRNEKSNTTLVPSGKLIFYFYHT